MSRRENIARRINGFYTVCEQVLLRTLLFSCFIFEVGRFVRWLWISRP